MFCRCILVSVYRIDTVQRSVCVCALENDVHTVFADTLDCKFLFQLGVTVNKQQKYGTRHTKCRAASHINSFETQRQCAIIICISIIMSNRVLCMPYTRCSLSFIVCLRGQKTERKKKKKMVKRSGVEEGKKRKKRNNNNNNVEMSMHGCISFLLCVYDLYRERVCIKIVQSPLSVAQISNSKTIWYWPSILVRGRKSMGAAMIEIVVFFLQTTQRAITTAHENNIHGRKLLNSQALARAITSAISATN